MTQDTTTSYEVISAISHVHQWIPASPLLKVKLERGQKSTFAWEITYEGTNSDDVLALIRDVNNRLKQEYAQPEEQKEVNHP